MATISKPRDLSMCWEYKNPAPPCTRCLGLHYNKRPVLIDNTWMYLCTNCRQLLGLIEKVEVRPAANEKISKRKARALLEEAMRTNTITELAKRPSFASWLSTIFS